MTSKTLFLLRIRNLMHMIFPRWAGIAEDWRKTIKYRQIIHHSGFVLPLPPYIKRSIILRYALDHHCKTFVETGTQYGDTPWLFRNRFETIYTIELSPTLARMARKRFKHCSHIKLVEGNSGDKLAELLPMLQSKTLFWLDGHYSAGLTACGATNCPIYGELESIAQLCKVPCVILIDDARCFGHDKDYPSLQELEDFVRVAFPQYETRVSNDIVSITPVARIGESATQAFEA